jgi:hypothetical protein
MKFTKEQKEALWADFKALPTAKKVDYIFDYYKWPIILTIVAVIIIVSTVVRTVTRKNDTLYLAAVNVSFGSETEATLTEDFIEYEGLNTKRNQVYLYTAMYLSENPSEVDHEYAYASRMKLMAAVNAQEMDVFLMNREAYDLLSQSGYLAELGDILTDELYSAVEPYLTENDVIIEDNKLDVLLNEADERRTVTESYVNAMRVSDSDVLRAAGFEGDVYFGVAVNTPRPDVAADYIAYLTAN